MLVHLPIVILTSMYPIPIADAVPKFNISRECQSEGGTKDTQDKCAKDETQARDQLQKEWTQFTASDKTQCYGETNADGSPSYVELLTCLQMARDVKKSSR